MDRLFARLKINRPVWRINWSIVDDPALFQPTGHGSTESRPDITVDNIADQLWIRMERQTLRRLPRSNDILFTIRIYVHPLSYLTTQPDQAARLASTWRGLDEDIQIYKSMLPFKETMLAWLDKIVKPKVG